MDYCSNKRSAYTDNEIASLIRAKMEKDNLSSYDMYLLYRDRYGLCNQQTIDFMLDGTIAYNMTMLDIASGYLGIKFEDLTEIIEDDLEKISFRNCNDEDARDFAFMVSSLFSEIIRQDKFSR